MALSEDQLAFYRQNGYLLASGLISAPVGARAEAAMWKLMGMDAADASTWSTVPESADRFGRQADSLQIAPDRYGVGQCGDQAQASSTGGADGDSERKDPG